MPCGDGSAAETSRDSVDELKVFDQRADTIGPSAETEVAIMTDSFRFDVVQVGELSVKMRELRYLQR